MTFRVGDRVVVKNSDTVQSYSTGRLGTVINIDFHAVMPFTVLLDTPITDKEVYNFYEDNLELYWSDDTEKQEVEPSYYDFPQGIEVRHISAHLTSFGGQALQYVARATRLDGRNKGNPIEDLTKALDFIQWEIDRLRELE